MPFRISAANMAALLRSAKLLRISPSSLLHITGTKRNRPPLSRLYSGALGVSRTGVCSRLISPAVGNVISGRVWPHAVGCVRGYVVATDNKDEASVLWSKQARHFDWAVAKLDGSVRWTGHITKSLLLKVFNDTCRIGCPSGNLALLLLRSCGSLLPEVPLEERTELAHHVWKKLQELGAQYDISHYNALLKVYLQNEFRFSPNEFLAKMEAANIQPNRVTYQRLIAAYCQNGNIEGASTILGFMKRKDLPITEAVFNSLVTGHSRAGDIESAKNILSVMRGVGIEPGPDTYVSLLTAFAEKGDMDSVKKTMEDAESAHCNLMDRDILQVIFSLAKAGHHEHIPEMVGRLRNERGYVPDAMNMCVSLVTQGLVDTALHILKTFSTLELDSYNNNNNNNFVNLGNIILRHCINMDMPVEKISQFCKELQESNPQSTPLIFSLHTALKAKKTDMSFDLMKILKEQGSPLRIHYFWPLLVPHVMTQDTAELLKILKGMQELGVSPDSETFITYIIPAFPSIEEAKQALLDIGLPLDSKDFFSVEVRILAVKDLAKIYELLSDPSAPSLDYRMFHNALILAIRKSDDVENLVKLTLLLCNDKRFSVQDFKPAEALSYFLYNLFSTLRPEEVQAREETLRKYLNQLQDQNVGITLSSYKGIRNVLESRLVPALIKDVHALVSHSRTDGASSDYMLAVSGVTGLKEPEASLEVKLAELKANNKPFGFLLTKAIQAHCSDENLELALELKNQYAEDMTASCYAILINECCHHGNVEEAINLKRELSQKDPSVVLDVSKYLALIRTLSSNGRVEEAVDILKEMKEKEVLITDKHVTMLFHMLNSLVAKGGVPVIRPLMDTIFTLDLAKPSTSLCSPLISAYLDSNDVAGALEAVEYCQKHFNNLPRVHDILTVLVEKEETELLQKAMGIFTQGRGEMNAMYDLFFAFLQTGRYREARRVIETPGLRARPGRLQWYAEKCISTKQMEPLEEMIDMTAKLFECDRDEMYSYIFRLCKETNNWKKAELVWMKMQEENVIPRQRTLQMLADILRTNGQEVPFEMPETWYERSAAVTPTQPKMDTKVQTQLLSLCKEGKAKEAIVLLKEADEMNVSLSSTTYDQLIRFMLAEGEMEDATVVLNIATSRVPGFHLSAPASNMFIITQTKKGQVKDAVEGLKTMLAADLVPSRLAVTRLLQALGSHGDLEGIQEVESLTKDLSTENNWKSAVFLNSRALAHIKNDDLDTAVEMLESVYTSPDTMKPRLSFVFRKLLVEGNDKALDKLSAMADRLANHFACYRPSLDLFFVLVDMDKLEDAKFMLARCNALAEQKVALNGYLFQTTKTPGQLGKVKSLLSLIPDVIEKEEVYKYMMKCHALDKDLPSAKALYEQMQKEEVVINELTLKRLAVLYREAGETVPFPEPPRSFKFYADKLRDRTSEDKMEAEE